MSIFTPFSFVKQAPAAGGPFNPELVANLYYWWDFTDSGSMTFSSGTTIATVSNKATRTSGNETLNAVTGAPAYSNPLSGSRFTSTDAISNTAVAGTGGNLDTLFSGNDATVIWIGSIVNFNSVTSSFDNNTLWGAAGTGFDDVRFGVTSVATAPVGNYTTCASDNSVSATYRYLTYYKDYLTSADFYGYRTYNTNFATAGTSMFLAATIDFSGSFYSSVNTQRNAQSLCSTQFNTVNARVNNTGTNRGFKVNARSRTGTAMSADQFVQHILIYNGLLTDSDITTIYNSWAGI